VAGIYFTGEEDDMQQWARVQFSHGIRTVPAGSMKFVDFSKPDPGAERVERFLVAAQRAMAEGEYTLAAQRLIYARDAEPANVAVLRLLTLAFWNAGNLEAAARAVNEWARADAGRPAAHRFAARIYEDIGAIDLAEEAAVRAVRRGPTDAGAWERLGRLRLMLLDREGALEALRRAAELGGGEPVRELIEQALVLEPPTVSAV
jgi:tetratricopeptide (TPR) repeat protein